MKRPDLQLLVRVMLVIALFVLASAWLGYRQHPADDLVNSAMAVFRKNLAAPFGVALVLAVLHWAGFLDFSGRSRQATSRRTTYDHPEAPPDIGSADSPYDSYGHVKSLSDD